MFPTSGAHPFFSILQLRRHESFKIEEYFILPKTWNCLRLILFLKWLSPLKNKPYPFQFEKKKKNQNPPQKNLTSKIQLEATL